MNIKEFFFSQVIMFTESGLADYYPQVLVSTILTGYFYLLAFVTPRPAKKKTK